MTSRHVSLAYLKATQTFQATICYYYHTSKFYILCSIYLIYVTDSSSSDTSEWHESSYSSSDELNKSSKNAKRKVLPNYDSSASEANTSTQFGQ